MYFEHVGEVRYFNHKNGDIGILTLKERNWDGNVNNIINNLECL